MTVIIRGSNGGSVNNSNVYNIYNNDVYHLEENYEILCEDISNVTPLTGTLNNNIVTSSGNFIIPKNIPFTILNKNKIVYINDNIIQSELAESVDSNILDTTAFTYKNILTVSNKIFTIDPSYSRYYISEEPLSVITYYSLPEIAHRLVWYTAMDGIIYVFIPIYASNYTSNYYTNFYKYDINTNTWTLITSKITNYLFMQESLSANYAAIEQYNNEIYIICRTFSYSRTTFIKYNKSGVVTELNYKILRDYCNSNGNCDPDALIPYKNNIYCRFIENYGFSRIYYDISKNVWINMIYDDNYKYIYNYMFSIINCIGNSIRFTKNNNPIVLNDGIIRIINNDYTFDDVLYFTKSGDKFSNFMIHTELMISQYFMINNNLYIVITRRDNVSGMYLFKIVFSLKCYLKKGWKINNNIIDADGLYDLSNYENIEIEI